MYILANELSIHEQFNGISSFHEALERLILIRNTVGKFDHYVYFNSAFVQKSPLVGMKMQRAIGKIPIKEKRNSIMNWLTSFGPFWDDQQNHHPDDWLECRGEIVTDTAVGEAAFQKMDGVECGLVSMTPSDWNDPSLDVIWIQEDAGLGNKKVAVENWWDASTLEKRLQETAPPIKSWNNLRNRATKQFTRLTFTDDCFAPLDGHSFKKCEVDRFIKLFSILDQFAQSFDENGERTPKGQEIYQQHFTGENALFSDSSETEKKKFRKDLTFPHPNKPGKSLSCTWHGKVRHGNLRLHFSWPIQAGKPVYIVYAGPKITKK